MDTKRCRRETVAERGLITTPTHDVDKVLAKKASERMGIHFHINNRMQVGCVHRVSALWQRRRRRSSVASRG